MHNLPQDMIGSIVALVIVAIVVVVRIRNLRKSTPLRFDRMWIVPAIFVALTALNLFQFPLHGREWAWFGAAAIVGGVLGWQRGKLMPIRHDPETGALMVHGSPMALIFLVAIFAARLAIQGIAALEADGLGIRIGLLNDAFVVFALGLFTVQRIEMALRARRLMAAAPRAAAGAARA